MPASQLRVAGAARAVVWRRGRDGLATCAAVSPAARCQATRARHHCYSRATLLAHSHSWTAAGWQHAHLCQYQIDAFLITAIFVPHSYPRPKVRLRERGRIASCAAVSPAAYCHHLWQAPSPHSAGRSKLASCAAVPPSTLLPQL